MNRKEIVRLLKKAMSLVESGWIKRYFVADVDIPGATHYCAEGALLKAANVFVKEWDEEFPEFLNTIDLDWGRYFLARAMSPKSRLEAPDSSVIRRFNDDPKRTKNEVLKAYRKAIALAEAAPSPNTKSKKVAAKKAKKKKKP